MGKVHSGGFNALTGFTRQESAPLDDSSIVDFLNDLKTLEKCYKMHPVGVLEDTKWYYWNGLDQTDLSNWLTFGSDSSGSGNILVSSALDSTSEATVLSSNGAKLLNDKIVVIQNILLADDTALDTAQERLDRIKELATSVGNLTSADIDGLVAQLNDKADDAEFQNFIQGIDTTIGNYLRSFVDENGITLMQVPLSKSIVLKGLTAGYDQIEDEYYIESYYGKPVILGVEPTSIIPNTTATIIFSGAKFDDETTVTTDSVDVIVNYVTFALDPIYKNIILKVNITTLNGYEGAFSFVFNNGKNSDPFYYEVLLGELFRPITSEWTLTEPIEIDNANISVQTYDSQGSAIWDREVDISRDWKIDWGVRATSLGTIHRGDNSARNANIRLYDAIDNTLLFELGVYSESSRTRTGLRASISTIGIIGYIDVVQSSSFADVLTQIEGSVYSLRWLSGVLCLYRDDVLKYTFSSQVLPNNLNIAVAVAVSDVVNLSYVEFPIA